MALTVLPNLITKGVQATFHDALANYPSFYAPHCTVLGSNTKVEPYAMAGFIPQPRLFLDERSIQTVRDFTFNVTNNEYELSLAIKRADIEDDQTGTIMMRIREAAEVWAQYKDYLFTQLIANGATSGYNGFDGTTFYADTHTAIGGSGTFDNNLGLDCASASVPTSAELATMIADAKAKMYKFNNDQGYPFNALALRQLRLVVPPTWESACAELKGASIYPSAAGTASRSNVFQNWFDYDVTPFLSGDTIAAFNAVGAVRKPFIYQQRTELEIQVLDSPDMLALHNALLILCRQRFVFAYGDPRRSIKMTIS